MHTNEKKKLVISNSKYSCSVPETKAAEMNGQDLFVNRYCLEQALC